MVNGQQCRLARSSGVCRGEFQCWASASEARFAKNVAPIIREIKSTGRRGGVGPAVGIFESANASSFDPGAGPRPKCRPPKLWSMLLSLRLSSDTRRQSSKTKVNPSYYAIFVQCNNLYCSAPKEMLFNGTEELGCKSVQRSAPGPGNGRQRATGGAAISKKTSP